MTDARRVPSDVKPMRFALDRLFGDTARTRQTQSRTRKSATDIKGKRHEIVSRQPTNNVKKS